MIWVTIRIHDPDYTADPMDWWQSSYTELQLMRVASPVVSSTLPVLATAGWDRVSMLIGFLYKVGNSLKSWKQRSQHTRPIVHARTLNIGAIQRHYSTV